MKQPIQKQKTRFLGGFFVSEEIKKVTFICAVDLVFNENDTIFNRYKCTVIRIKGFIDGK